MVVIPMVTMDLVEHMVSSLPSFVDNCLSDTLQTVTILYVLFEVCRSTISDSLLLGPDKILELPHLCSQPVKLIHFLLDAELWEYVNLVFSWLQALWIGIGDHFIRHAEVSLDVDDLGRTSLSEHSGKSNILGSLSIHGFDNELQEL